MKLDLPGEPKTIVESCGDETISITQDGNTVSLAAVQLAYILQEFGRFTVQVAPSTTWRGIEGTGKI